MTASHGVNMEARMDHPVIRDSVRDSLGLIDRFPHWGLSPVSALTIGLGTLFVQYDIFNINVSFVQTCQALVDGCTPQTADQHIGLPILLSLIGYAVGALSLGPLADRFGRHKLLIVSMAITGFGSLYSMLSGDYSDFVASRFVTGIGVGADLAIINVYVSEVAPRRLRGGYTGLMFVLASIGSALGIWLGLLLTTPSTPWPDGLPLAQASASFDDGWRWIYGIGAVLALFSLLLRFSLPESPRWLVAHGRVETAEVVIEEMRLRATRRHGLLPPEADAADVAGEQTASTGTVEAVGELFRSRRYLSRLALLSLSWMLAYLTVYAFAGAFTSVLVRLDHTVASAGMVSAVGLVGFIVAALVARSLTDRLDRKWWMLLGAVIAVVGAMLVSYGGTSGWPVFAGALVLFFGQNVWFPAQYALTAESFPTRSRATGYAITDSIGHVGGGVGVFFLVGALDKLPFQGTMLVLVAFLLAGGLVNLSAPRTRNRALEAIST